MNEIGQSQPIGNPAEGAPAPQAQENLLPQHQVNALVGGARQNGYDKGYKEGLNAAQPSQTQSVGVDQDTARKIAEETFARQHQEFQQKLIAQQQTQQAEQTLQQLTQKITEAKASHLPDFDQVVDFKNFVPAPEVLHYANGVDNSADVIYDLAKNPGKVAQIVALNRTGMTGMAQQAIRQLSDSIKQNQNATQQAKSPEPLNQIKPSNIGLGNGSGKESVSELRSNPRYRG